MRITATRWHLLGASACALFFVSCSSSSDSSPASRGGSDESARANAPKDVRVIEVQATSSGAQTVKELNARIEHLRQRAADPKTAASQQFSYSQELVELHLSRAHFFGMVSDYGAALERADQLAKTHSQKHNVYLLRGRARAAVHNWAGALEDASTARDAGAPKQSVDQLEALVAFATGNLKDALAIRSTWAERVPDLSTRTDLALVQVAMGKITQANNQFDKAVMIYKSVSPMPLAATWFQQGFMWERQNQTARAMHYYQLAYERLPQYAPLVSHMAGLEAKAGDRKTAIARLRDLIRNSDNPEYMGQLGELLMEDGKPDEAATLIADAKAAYESLLTEHPLALADHAARFYLGPGKDAARALALATENLDSRKTDEAYQLYLDAADAAKADPKAACAAADAAAAREYASSYLLFAASRAYKACQRDADATKAIAAADKAERQR